MKVAISSASFEPALNGGSMTQLEWLEWCGTEVEANGVVFDARHFPRTDVEYLAQLAKLAVDRGLGAAAVRCDVALGSEDDGIDGELERWIEVAFALKAPVLIVPTAPRGASAVLAWQRALQALKLAARSAKKANVVIALANAPGTLCAEGADIKRFAKDVDSAWIRFAIDPSTLAAADLAAATERLTIVMSTIAGAPQALERFAGFRGYLALDVNGRDAQDVTAALADLNRANRLHIRF